MARPVLPEVAVVVVVVLGQAKIVELMRESLQALVVLAGLVEC
jgi:hypothetical protein